MLGHHVGGLLLRPVLHDRRPHLSLHRSDQHTVLINCHYPIDANSFVLQYGIIVKKSDTLPEDVAMQTAIALGDFVKMGFEQDVAIWRNKARIDNPLLVEEDGPVYQLRRWYEQFYVDAADVDVRTWWTASSSRSTPPDRGSSGWRKWRRTSRHGADAQVAGASDPSDDRAPRQPARDAPMVPVACRRCGAAVLARKSSWDQTSVQWSAAGVGAVSGATRGGEDQRARAWACSSRAPRCGIRSRWPPAKGALPIVDETVSVAQ